MALAYHTGTQFLLKYKVVAGLPEARRIPSQNSATTSVPPQSVSNQIPEGLDRL